MAIYNGNGVTWHMIGINASWQMSSVVHALKHFQSFVAKGFQVAQAIDSAVKCIQTQSGTWPEDNRPSAQQRKWYDLYNTVW